MKFYHPLSSVLIAASIVIVQPQIATALSSQQVREIAKDITVRIQSEYGSSGSGVIIKKDGETYYVITNFHVVKEPIKYTLVTPDRKRYPIDYSTVKNGALIDLAVIQFKTQKSYKTAKIGNSKLLRTGMPTYISGFTKNKLDYEFRFRRGEVIANTTQLYDYGLIYTNNTLSGMSGGAVLNQDGELVAINGRGGTVDFYNHLEEIITGNAQGITIETILKVGLVELDPKIDNINNSIEPTADDFYALGLKKEDEFNNLQAIAAYDEAIKLNPNFSYAYFKRGYKYYKLEDYAKALPDLNRAESLGLQHPDLYNTRGLTRYQLGKYQESVSDFTEAIALDSQYHYAYYNRGDSYHKLSEYAKAIEDYTEAIRLNPEDYNLYLSRANAYYSSYDRLPQALLDYTKAISLSESSYTAYYYRGNVYRSLGQHNRAISDYTGAIAIKSDYADAYYSRGLTWNDLNNYGKAIEDFTSYIIFKPENSNGYSNRALSYKKQKLYHLALSDYTKAINLDREGKYYYGDRALVYYEIGQLDAAIADWRVYRQDSPGDWNASTDLAIAVALYHQGKKAEAIQLGKSAVNKRDYLADWNTIKTLGWGDRLLEDTQYFFQDPTVKASIPNNLPGISQKRQPNNFTFSLPLLNTPPKPSTRNKVRRRKPSRLKVPSIYFGSPPSLDRVPRSPVFNPNVLPVPILPKLKAH